MTARVPRTQAEKAALDDKRRLIWRHCGYLGSARMTQVFLASLNGSPTVTDEAKATARQMKVLLATLQQQLKERKPL